MSHSLYIIILSLTSVASWTAWFLVVTRLDPEEITGAFPFIMFYFTLFLAIMATVSIIAFYIRVWLSKNEVYFVYLNDSIREGVLVSLTVLILLWLQFYRVLTIWDALLLFVALALLEVFLLSRKR